MDFRDYPLNEYDGWWDNPGQPAAADEAGIRVSNGSFNVIDDNYVTHGAVGIRIENGEGNVVTNNRIDNVSKTFLDQGRKTFAKVLPF
jgi:parallel beta-helix repeat protein